MLVEEWGWVCWWAKSGQPSRIYIGTGAANLILVPEKLGLDAAIRLENRAQIIPKWAGLRFVRPTSNSNLRLGSLSVSYFTCVELPNILVCHTALIFYFDQACHSFPMLLVIITHLQLCWGSWAMRTLLPTNLLYLISVWHIATVFLLTMMSGPKQVGPIYWDAWI